MQTIKNIKDLKGKRVIVRVDFNVPVEGGKVVDDFRIKKALPTINFLTKKGAKVILISHLGKDGDSLEPVYKVLKKFIKVDFVQEVIGVNATKAVGEMNNGDVLLLENLRKEKGEQEKNKVFAVELSKFGDIYVNDAFPVSHREDTSIVLLPKILPAYAGLQMEEEVKHLSLVLKTPNNKNRHPFLFILGGSKFSTKMPLIKKYLKLADCVFIGGALADDFLKAKGYEVGKSLVDSENYGIENIIKNKKIILPTDVVVSVDGKLVNKKANEVSRSETILDIGAQSIKDLEIYIKKSKLILWNGPLGKYEEGGAVATKKLLKAVAGSRAISIIGGGDTASVISEMGIEKYFTFVSTGGGATLDFLANGTLPGIKALR